MVALTTKQSAQGNEEVRHPMELIMTSFGLSHLSSQPYEQRGESVHPSLGPHAWSGYFDRMPPVSMLPSNQRLLPDYAALLLCERLILDAESWDRLSNGHYYDGYSEVAEALKVLHSEGFVRVVDFGSIVAKNRDLLTEMLERDLKHVEDWVGPLKESVATWQRFTNSMSIMLRSGYCEIFRTALSHADHKPTEVSEGGADVCLGALHGAKNMAAGKLWEYQDFEDALRSSERRRYARYRNAIKHELAGYLSLVNANLVISNALDAGFHDWYDFAPFYRHKLFGIGQRERPEETKAEKARQLFQVFTPETASWNAGSFLKVLKDKRIEDLRGFIDLAAREGTEFDLEFATRTLKEVLRVEDRVSRARQFVSYLTLPIGLIPWAGTILQKASEEAAGRIIENKAKREFRWFYLISELAPENQPLE